MRYTNGFKNSILKKVLPPENRPISSVAKETGLSPVTIRSWLSRLKEGSVELIASLLEPLPSQICLKEKLKLLLESKRLKEEELGEWLRQHGLHSEHLSLWEQELAEIMTTKQTDMKRENFELRTENKKLKQELTRSQAGLAEALILMTLKKKARNLFYPSEEV